MSNPPLGVGIFKITGDDSQFRGVLGGLAGQVTSQGKAAEAVASSAFGAVGAVAGARISAGVSAGIGGISNTFASQGTASGKSFAAGIAASTAGLGSSIAAPLANAPAVIGAIGTAAGNTFSSGVRSTTAGIGSSISNPLSGVASTIGGYGFNAGKLFTSGIIGNTNQIANSIINPLGSLQGTFGSIGSNSGRLFSTGVLGATSALPNAIATPLGVLPSSFASVGGTSGRSFASAVSSQMGSIVAAAQSVASRMSAPFINAGKAMGGQLGSAISQRVRYGVSNKIVGAGAGAVGSLFDTKNYAEFDAEMRRVETLAPGRRGELTAQVQRVSKRLNYGSKSVDIAKGLYEVLSSNFSQTNEITALAEAGTKVSLAGGGRANSLDTIKAVTSLANILRNSGIDGSGKQKLDVVRDASKLAGILTGFQNTSTGYTEKVTASSIGTLLQPATALKINTYDALGVAAVASNTLGPGKVNAGLPGVFKAIQKPSSQATEQAKELGFDFSAQAVQDKGIIGFLTELNGKLAEYQKIHGEASKVTALSKLFGSVQAGRVVGAVGENIPLIKESSDAIKKSDVDANVAISQKGLIAQQTAFKNSLVELDIQIKSGLVGTVLTDAFKSASIGIALLSDGLKSLSGWFEGLNEPSQSIIKAIGGVAFGATALAIGLIGAGIAIGLIGPPLVAAGAIVGGFAVGLGSIALAAAPIAIPLLAAGAAVGLIAKAFGATNTQAFAAGLTAVVVGLAVLFGPAAIASIAAGTSALIIGFSGVAVAAGAALLPLLPWIAGAAAVAAGLYLLYKAFEAAAPYFAAFTSRSIAAITGWAQSIGKWISNIGTGFTGLATSIGKSIGSWIDNIKNVPNVVGSAFTSAVGFANNLRDGINGAMNSIIVKIKEAIDWILDIPAKIQRAAESVNIFNQKKPQASPATSSSSDYGPEARGGDEGVLIAGGNGVSGIGKVRKRPQNPEGVEVMASTYEPGGKGKYEGPKRDVKGKYLDPRDLAVAIPGLTQGGIPNAIPYGTIVNVYNPSTGKSSDATVRDAGPFAPGRQADLSTGLAKKIGFGGLGGVVIKIVELPPGFDPNRTYQFGEAKVFGSDRRSNILPGPSIGGGSPPPPPQATPSSSSGFVPPPPPNDILSESFKPPDEGRPLSDEDKRIRARYQGELAIYQGQRDLEQVTGMFPQWIKQLNRGGVKPPSNTRNIEPPVGSVSFDEITTPPQTRDIEPPIGSASFDEVEPPNPSLEINDPTLFPRTSKELQDFKGKQQAKDANFANEIARIRQQLRGYRPLKGKAKEKEDEAFASEISRIRQQIDGVTGAANLKNAATDQQVASGTIEPSTGDEIKASRLRELFTSLADLNPRVNGLRNRYGNNPEFKNQLDALEVTIRNIGKDASTATKSTESASVAAQVEEYKKLLDVQIKVGEERQQLVKNERIINPDRVSERQELESILVIRQQTAKALLSSVPAIEAFRNAQKDPAVIEGANELLVKIRQIDVEIIAATKSQQELDRAATAAAQTNKALANEIGTGARAIFNDIFKGAKNLESILDGIINKIADIGINALFDRAVGGNGGGGGLLSTIGSWLGFSGGGEVRNYATGGMVNALGSIGAMSAALKREGPNSVPAALTIGEQVLNLSQAPIYRAMVADGTWREMERIYSYSAGGAVGGYAPTASPNYNTPSSFGQSDRTQISVVVDRINSVDYVSLDQVQAMFNVNMPIAAKAGASIAERNLGNTSYRQRNGIN